MFHFETFRIILNPSSVKKESNTWQCQQCVTKLYGFELLTLPSVALFFD